MRFFNLLFTLVSWLCANTVGGTPNIACKMGEVLNDFYPFMIKIVEMTGDTFHTKAHGSLIHKSHVLSTCGPFYDYSEDIEPHDILLIGLTADDVECDQRRPAERVLLHPDCRDVDPTQNLVVNDISVWITTEWEVAFHSQELHGSFTKPKRPMYDFYEAFPSSDYLRYLQLFMGLSGCESGNKCIMPVFEFEIQQINNKTADHMRRRNEEGPLNSVQYMGWRECQTWLASTNVDVPEDHAAFFCGIDTGENPAKSLPENQFGMTADWFSGAVAVCRGKVPFGLSSRTIRTSRMAKNGTESIKEVIELRVFVSLLKYERWIAWVTGATPFSLGRITSGNPIINFMMIICTLCYSM